MRQINNRNVNIEKIQSLIFKAIHIKQNKKAAKTLN